MASRLELRRATNQRSLRVVADPVVWRSTPSLVIDPPPLSLTGGLGEAHDQFLVGDEHLAVVGDVRRSRREPPRRKCRPERPGPPAIARRILQKSGGFDDG